jgi:hypothetical protein
VADHQAPLDRDDAPRSPLLADAEADNELESGRGEDGGKEFSACIKKASDLTMYGATWCGAAEAGLLTLGTAAPDG